MTEMSLEHKVPAMTDSDRQTAALFKKISEFRKLLNAQDWDDDAYFNNQNNPSSGYPYLSEKKLKNNIKALPPMAGLECYTVFSDVQVLPAVGRMPCHYIVKGTMYLVDVDTGARQAYPAFGEAADSGDKGLRKAETSALKAIFDNNFFISDRSVEDDADDGSHKFTSKEEREEIVSSMADLLVSTPAPAAEPAKPEHAPVEAAPAPAAAPVQSTLTEPAPAAEKAISPLQEKAIARLLANFEAAVKSGARSEDEFSKLKFDADNATTASKASQLLKFWKV